MIAIFKIYRGVARVARTDNNRIKRNIKKKGGKE